MGDLKPLGSEKLQGNAKIQRILELTYYQTDNKGDKKPVDAEYLSESINGVYGIVKERDGYYVKKGLTESNLDYIGGMFMKNKNRFKSYGDALKRLELLKGQESVLQEDTKYMLKINKPKPSIDTAEGIPPAPVPVDTAPVAPPAPDAGMEGMPPPEDTGGEMPDMGDEDEGGDFLKGIQKLTGKLGEKLRDHMDEMESDDLKYVLNSVISAIDLTKLDDGDKDEVVSQLEGDEDMGDDGMTGEDPGAETPDMGAGSIPPSDNGDKELGEVDALEELINTPFDFNDDGDKPYDGEVDEVKHKEVDVEPESEEDSSEVCVDCHGTGVMKGSECPTCHGEGVVYNTGEGDDEIEKFISKDKFSAESDDLFDDDPGYDPNEMGEEYTGEYIPVPDDSADIKSKDIELTELTDMINNTVKETLSKYFE